MSLRDFQPPGLVGVARCDTCTNCCEACLYMAQFLRVHPHRGWNAHEGDSRNAAARRNLGAANGQLPTVPGGNEGIVVLEV
jgi:hypothetical protein